MPTTLTLSLAGLSRESYTVTIAADVSVTFADLVGFGDSFEEFVSDNGRSDRIERGPVQGTEPVLDDPTSGHRADEPNGPVTDELAERREADRTADFDPDAPVETEVPKATEVVAEIRSADSPEQVQGLADGDDRKTVQDAADKRLAQLEE